MPLMRNTYSCEPSIILSMTAGLIASSCGNWPCFTKPSALVSSPRFPILPTQYADVALLESARFKLTTLTRHKPPILTAVVKHGFLSGFSHKKLYMRNIKTVNGLTDITSDTQYTTLASQEAKLLNKVGMGFSQKALRGKPRALNMRRVTKITPTASETSVIEAVAY
jgi:hypothetical protein